MTFTCHYDSPLGGITLAATESGLCGLWFDGQKYFGHGLKEEAMTKETPLLLQTRQWLDVYFSGQQPDFALPCNLPALIFSRPSGKSYPPFLTVKPGPTKI